MTYAEILAKVRFISKASTGDYTDAEILADFNLLRKEYQLFILRSQGYSNDGIETIYTDLVNATGLSEGVTGYDGEYPFARATLKPIRIELKMTATGDYEPAEIYDINDNSNSEFEDYTDNFETPVVKIMRNSFWVRPLPTEDVTAGLKIIHASSNGAYIKASDGLTYFGDLSASGDIDQTLNEAFHKVYPLKLAMEYVNREPDKFNPKIQQEIIEWEDKIDDHYSSKIMKKMSFKPKQISFK